MEKTLSYDKTSFPLIFEYPSSASYSETIRKKYLIQVNLRETKDKFYRLSSADHEKNRSVGGGAMAAVFPKISIALLKGYVSASQSTTKKAHFMNLDELISLYMGDKFHPRNFCSDVVEANIEIPFGKGHAITFKHPSDSYYRSQVFVANDQNKYLLLNILYKHNGSSYSYYELEYILRSIRFRNAQELQIFE